jgi:hypothetical protein
MTTLEIENLSDPGGLSLADFNKAAVLRHEIIPEFFEDVGYVTWRRLPITEGLAQSRNYVDLTRPNYYISHIRSVYLTDDFDTPLTFIGDDPIKVLKAKVNTTPGRPGGWYIESTGTNFERISFDAIADITYTVAIEADTHIKFEDDTTAVQLDQFIPEFFQWALVEGLRRELYFHRYGVGDQRGATAGQKFNDWKVRAQKSPEMARKHKYKYVK